MCNVTDIMYVMDFNY